ncbi:MAG: MerR family transcriptional regulator [Rhodospirillaceae bacterium]|nr:MAG: MerR family transcriptional regulator [Rhodospirillaceae bacterium]
MSFDDSGDEAGHPGESRRVAKSDTAFRTISEVATDLGVPQHVLRFWESKFTQVRPLKRGGGRRYYRPEDVALLRRIRALLYDDGMTIRGVQKLLREPGGRPAEAVAPEAVGSPAASGRSSGQHLRQLLAELTALRDDLRDALREP